MPSNPGRAPRWLYFASILAGLLWLPLLPTDTVAQTVPGLQPDGTAQIANAGGDAVLLRAAPGYDAAAINAFPEGTAVDVLDGPIAAADGSLWYGVAVAGQSGYIVADFLAPLAAPAAPAPAPAEPAQPAQPAAGVAVATTDVNLRAGPSYDEAVLLVIPAGAAVTPTGESSGGFVAVTYGGQSGWVDAAYLSTEAPAAAPASAATDAPLISDPTAAPAGQTATATDVVNLRAGPSATDPVLRVLPPGSPVTITGAAANGFVPVWYNGTDGWVAVQYLDTSGTAPSSASATPNPGGIGTARTTESLNLRASPNATGPVLAVLPPGTVVETTAGPEGGFYQVSYGGQTGWVSGAFLQRIDDPVAPPDGPANQPPELEPDAETAGSGLIWPVTGGTWYIMQGYNGSSHQNQGSLWQYYYSFDLARRDGNTAGQTVISPATGTVRWLDPSTGGISIDIGNGHAVALFHVTIDGGLADGDPVRQGQYLGYVSGPGGPGFAGTPHIHFTLWATDDGGNWSRSAAPFVGPYAIGGQEFPDTGGANQYRGVEFTP